METEITFYQAFYDRFSLASLITLINENLFTDQYMLKSITPVDDYKFPLSDELREMAKNELRETDEIREHAIKAIRDWAMKNPRISTLRLDARFILRFLRAKKFSIPMAQETLERYLVLRKYFFEGEFIYQNFDYTIPSLYALVDNG